MPKRTPNVVAAHRPSVSDEAVRDATGRGWSDWFALLDAHEAFATDHKAIVALLRDEAELASGWWRQNVTVEYEKARGLRALAGQTADGSFQIGVQRTVDAPAEAAWQWLVARPERWVGACGRLPLGPGTTVRCDDGATIEIRSVRAGARVRLFWTPPGAERPTTVQATVTPKGARCTVGIHHERLADVGARNAMRGRWRAVLDELADSVASDEATVPAETEPTRGDTGGDTDGRRGPG